MTDVTCYNYMYLDPSTEAKIEVEGLCLLFKPLYVGKGKNDRKLHGKIALEEGKQLLTNRLLYVELKRLQRRGFDPVILSFNEGVSSDAALDLEKSIISKLGRKGIEPNGILCNRALGGEIPDTTGLAPPVKGRKMKDVLSPERYEAFMAACSKPKTEKAIKQMVATRKERGTYTTGKAHPRAKKFVLISPTGQAFEVVGGLKKFCAEHNLSWQTLFGNQNMGPLQLDRSRYKNTKRLSERFWNTLGWECRVTA